MIDFESSAIMNEPVSPLRSLSSNEEVKYKIIVRLGFFPQYVTMNETLCIPETITPIDKKYNILNENRNA